MNITPNRSALFYHPYAYLLLDVLHHILSYLEDCIDEAPFGFVLKKSQMVSLVDIPENIEERYSDYLHRYMSGVGLAGAYGVWMKLNTENSVQDVVVITLFFQREELPFFIYIPIQEPVRWWVEA